MCCPTNSARPECSSPATAPRPSPDRCFTWIAATRSWGCELSANQFCHIRAVHLVRERQQFVFAFQFEIGVFVQKLFHDLAVFFRLKAARAVNQNAAGFHLGRGLLEQIQLCGAEAFWFTA